MNPPETQSVIKLAPMTPTAPQPIDDPMAYVGQLMEKALSGGITEQSVAVVEKLTALFERMDEKRAEMKFNQAFVRLQKEMPNIKKERVVPTKSGGVKFTYAPFEDIMAQVEPVAQRNGFAIMFSQKYDEQRIIQVVTLIHDSGHSRSAEFAVRVGGGFTDGLTNAQIDQGASTSAKRGALCSILNIVTENDFEDAKNEGGFITKDQAQELERRVRESASDEVAFLKCADADKFDKIREGKYVMLDSLLRRKERTK
ncbi:MAG: ERF family protein [Pseudomonadota bacterium]